MHFKPLALLLLSTAYLTAAVPVRPNQDSPHDLLPRATTNPSRTQRGGDERIPSASEGTRGKRKKLDIATPSIEEEEEEEGVEGVGGVGVGVGVGGGGGGGEGGGEVEEVEEEGDPSSEITEKDPVVKSPSRSTSTTNRKKKFKQKGVDTTLGGVPETSESGSEGTRVPKKKKKKWGSRLWQSGLYKRIEGGGGAEGGMGR